MCIAMLTGRAFPAAGRAVPQSSAGFVAGGMAPAASAAPAVVRTVRRVSVWSTFPDAPGPPPRGAGVWLKLLHMNVELTRSGLVDAVSERAQRFGEPCRGARPGAGRQQLPD